MTASRNQQNRMHHRTPVLLVVSHRDNLPALNDALDTLGRNHEVVRASSAEEVPALLGNLGSRKPTLVFLDSADGAAVGLAILRRLKADEALKTIPVIILAPPGDARLINESFDLGAAGYVVKSPDAQELVEAVEAIDRYWTLSQVPQMD